MTAFATYPPPGASSRARWHAFGMAAAIEIALVVAVLAGAARHVQHDDAVVMTMALTTPPPAALPSPPKPDIPPPRAKAVPLPQIELPALQEPVPPMPVVPQAVTRDAEKDAPVIVAHVPPPPPAAASAPLSADYIAKMQAAVQAAFEYPMAAKAQDFKGRARVAFSLVDTHPSGARVIVSSGMNIVDRAALRAVEVASYPPAPDGLSHGDRVFEVWAGYVD